MATLNKSTKVLYGFVVMALTLQSFKLVVPRFFLKGQLLANDTFMEWSIIQILPSMYNYSNAFWISDFSYQQEEFNDIKDGLYDHNKIQVNHYPLKIISFTNSREHFFSTHPKSFYVKSSFRGISLMRAYESHISNGELIIELKVDDNKK